MANAQRNEHASKAASAVELLASLGVVEQDRGGRELVPKLVAVLAHHVDELLRANRVDQAEGSAAERREANAKHRTNVCVGV